MNKEKIKVKWLRWSTYRSESTIEHLTAEKEARVAKENEQYVVPYTEAGWKVLAVAEYQEGNYDDTMLYIQVDRWETDQEQQQRIEKHERYQKWQADVEKKKRDNMADPEWNEYKRLQQKFKLPLGQGYPAAGEQKPGI